MIFTTASVVVVVVVLGLFIVSRSLDLRFEQFSWIWEWIVEARERYGS